jgi:hypothetical protein
MGCRSAIFADGNAKTAEHPFGLFFGFQVLSCNFDSLKISSFLASPLQIRGIKRKEEVKMNKKFGTLVLAGTFILSTAIPMTVLAGPGGRMNGQTQQIRTQPKQQIRDQQRLRDGSCLDPAQKGSGAAQKKGNTYGPGDGTGNNAIGPKDGSGYGVPSTR